MNKQGNIYRKAEDIRQLFIDFFVGKNHTNVPSSSLVPAGDPTLLFTNSGMVPFKDVFLGIDKRPYKRAVTVQRCVRAGGKHNDLENVGYTARHHTFFEMLGNFSLGDYFKKKAISFSWEFVTEHLRLDPDKLWITIYHTDDEAKRIWHKDIGIPQQKIIKLDADNFWQMGNIGPCGPCSEIYYDHGPDIPGDLPGGPNEGDRYIEIWNLVFMQFNRDSDGKMHPLPLPSVDTGMGLERITAILQGVRNNYDTDIFASILDLTHELCQGKSDLASQRIIADHIRSAAFLIADGISPSNEGRGYVLRRIIRRALRHGNKLKIESPFFYKLLVPLINEMGQAYPLIKEKQNEVAAILRKEEDKFGQTLEQGLSLLSKQLKGIKESKSKASGGVLDGDTVFKLYDTYGFPPDLTEDIGREQGFRIDRVAFNQCMEEQRRRSRAYSMFHKRDYSLPANIPPTEFVGYEKLKLETIIINLLNEEGKQVKNLNQGEEGLVILKESPFYAESGGQIGDKGIISNAKGVFTVEDTQKQEGIFLHFGKMEEGIFEMSSKESAPTKVSAQINVRRREQINRHHTAAHLLHAALHEVLGKQAKQKGSHVADNSLRLDFAHSSSLSEEELLQVENKVNLNIRAGKDVVVSYKSLEEAKKEGAMALFGEKYGERVRVVDIPEASKELCGGTHVNNCREIEEFTIRNEHSIATGIRRIEAVASTAAYEIKLRQRKVLNQIKKIVSLGDEHKLLDKISDLVERLDKSEKEVERLIAFQQLTAAMKKLDSAHKSVIRSGGGVPLLLFEADDLQAGLLDQIADKCLAKISSGVVVLSNRKKAQEGKPKGDYTEGKVSFLVKCSRNFADKYPANDLLKHIVSQLGGSGGGSVTRAQGGGNDSPKVAAAINSVAKWIENRDTK